jgi:hypothetical protein
LNAFERWKKCRILKIERLGKETVNKHNAKVHALWRTDNEAFDHRLKYHSDISLAGTSCDFVKYSINAERRNKDFEISEKFFDKITKRSCYLCGFSSELGVGIDRFNNEIGYTEKNCKPCCNYCNYMKRDSNYLDFLDHIKKIVDFSESSEEIKELCEKSELNPMFNSNCIYSNENIDLLDFIF